MRYCMTYDPQHPEIDYYKGYADEILFEELPSATVISSFAENSFRVILCLEETGQLKEWYKTFDIKIRIPNTDYEYLIEECKNFSIPFFFQEPPTNEEELIYMVERLNVSDVYIAESLGFHLKDLANCLCHDKDSNKNIQIRVFPNVVQSKAKKAIPDIQKFFIRPEDLEIYDKNNLIDVCEMWGPLSKQKTFIRIYKEDKKWAGPLSEIIIGFQDELDNRFFFHPAFTLNRINCMQRCLWNQCNICSRAFEYVKLLEKKNLIIKQQIDKKEK